MYYFVFSYLLLPYRLHNFVAFILYYYYILWFHSYVTTLVLYTLICLLSLLLYSVFNSLYIINTCCWFFFCVGAAQPNNRTLVQAQWRQTSWILNVLAACDPHEARARFRVALIKTNSGSSVETTGRNKEYKQRSETVLNPWKESFSLENDHSVNYFSGSK